MTGWQTSRAFRYAGAHGREVMQRLFLLVFTAMFLLLPKAGAAEDSLVPFSSTAHQFSFSHSPALIEEKIDVPQALIALRSPEGGFPSFNVLVSAETYDPDTLNEERYRDKIINDYRAVGITDAHAVRTYSSLVAGKTVFTTEIRYQFKEQLLIAAVTLLPVASGKHFILTYMDLADQFYRRKVMREDMINSFKLLDQPSGAAGGLEAESPTPGASYWVTVLLLAGALLAVGIIVFKRRASSGTP